MQQNVADLAGCLCNGRPPGRYPGKNLFDTQHLRKDAGIIKGFGLTRCHHVARRTSPLYRTEGARLALVAPAGAAVAPPILSVNQGENSRACI